MTKNGLTIQETNPDKVTRTLMHAVPPDAFPITMGRSSGNKIVFASNDTAVSRNQFELAKDRNGYVIKNISRSTEALIEQNNRLFKPGDSYKFCDDLDILVSNTKLSFRTQGMADSHALVLTESGGKTRKFPLHKGDRLTIGSSKKDCKIVLADEGVSKKHAELFCSEDGKFILRDTESKNGVYIKDEATNDTVKISETELAVGDRFCIGTVMGMIAVEERAVKSRGARYKWLIYGIMAIAAIGILMLPTKKTSIPNEKPKLDTFDDKIKEAWRVANREERRSYLLPLKSLAKAELRQQAVDKLIEINDCEVQFVSCIGNMESQIKALQARIEENTWSPDVYSMSFDNTGLSNAMKHYLEALKNMDTTANGAGMSVDNILAGLDSDIKKKAQDMSDRVNHLNTDLSEMHSMLFEWKQKGLVTGQDADKKLKKYIPELIPQRSEKIVSEYDAFVAYNKLVNDALSRLTDMIVLICEGSRIENIHRIIERIEMPSIPTKVSPSLMSYATDKDKTNLFERVKKSAIIMVEKGSSVEKWRAAGDMLSQLAVLGNSTESSKLRESLKKYRKGFETSIKSGAVDLKRQMEELLKYSNSGWDDNKIKQAAGVLPNGEYVRSLTEIREESLSGEVRILSGRLEKNIRDYCEDLYVKAQYDISAQESTRRYAERVMSIVLVLKNKDVGAKDSERCFGWADKLQTWAAGIIK